LTGILAVTRTRANKIFKIIGDTLNLYTATRELKLAETDLKGREELNRYRNTTDYPKNNNLLITEVIQMSEFDTSRDASVAWGRLPQWVTHSDYRAYYFITGFAIERRVNGVLTGGIDVDNTIWGEAHKKKWGKWKLRNSFRPIWRLNGHWNTILNMKPCPDGCLCNVGVTNTLPHELYTGAGTINYEIINPINEYTVDRSYQWWRTMEAKGIYDDIFADLFCGSDPLAFRVTYMDVNVALVGYIPPGDWTSLGVHIYQE